MENKYKHFEKAVINAGVGRLRQQGQFEEKILPEIIQTMAAITGQKPAPRPAKKSIAAFKTRAGDIVGLKTTLRGKRMADFIGRLVSIVLPRVRDFRGIALNNIDSEGNLNIGFRDQYAFPEISPEKSKYGFGLQINIKVDAKSRDEAIRLYREAGFPLQ